MERSRSWMFVPGHIQKMIDKAHGLPVDAIILDIEDGVLPASKPQARTLIAATLEKPAPHGAPKRYVRVNAMGHENAMLDIDAAVGPHVEGLVIPKVETVDQIQELERAVLKLEQARGIAAGRVKFVIAIESARGLLSAYALSSASPRICAALFGAEDYTRDLGMPVAREREARDLIYARSAIVNAAAAAQVQSVDGVWPDLKDTDGLIRDARQSRDLGFTGKSLIHPSQIDAINACFQPTAAEIEYAQKVVEAFKSGEERGLGAVAFGGQLLDRPIIDRAYATLELAGKNAG
jgi:citrate lyase subunit beta/citryl-CoA lyase